LNNGEDIKAKLVMLNGRKTSRWEARSSWKTSKKNWGPYSVYLTGACSAVYLFFAEALSEDGRLRIREPALKGCEEKGPFLDGN